MEQAPQIDQMDEKESIEKAKTLMAEEKWGEAISLLKPFRELGDFSINGLDILAHCYSRSKKYDEAISIYEGLHERYPNEAKWLYCLAYQYKSKKDVQGAIKAYEKCLELSPKWVKVLGELGLLYEESGSTKRALEIYRNGIQTYKAMRPDGQKELAAIYSKLSARAAKLKCAAENITETDKNEAEYLFRESIAGDPENSDTWYRLGDFYLNATNMMRLFNIFKRQSHFLQKKNMSRTKLHRLISKKGIITKH